MIVDILSDPHFDSYFNGPTLSENAVETVYTHIFTDNDKRTTGDVLVISGDLGHNNNQNIQALKLIKKIFKYKHIICVLGNHDYYLIDMHAISDYKGSSLFRAEEMRKLINETENMYCLDGDIIEIEGIRFGGCDSWYDGEYTKKHFKGKTEKNVSALWETDMADADYLFGMDWLSHARKEKEKINRIYKKVDIMITHVSPLIEKEYISISYKEEESTGFFTFDGSKYIREGSMKYWIYGHTHIEAKNKLHGVTCICNPMGYPKENSNGEWTWIRSIDILM